MSREVLVLREDEIREVLDMRSCIDVVETAFTAYSTGGAELPALIHLEVPEYKGEIHVKTGYIHGGEIYAAKFASGFSGVNDGVVLAFDATNGAPLALLFDNGFITDIRTGAAGGVAAKHLARGNAKVVAMIGTGAQARYQLDALVLVRPFSEVRVWGRSPDRAQLCTEDLAARPGLPENCHYKTAPTVREAVDGADVVITATASREPLVEADWLGRGTHLTALGSDGPGKQELHPDVLARADLLVADSRVQCAERGELQHAADERLRSGQGVVELGEITSGRIPGRTSEDQITVCDLTGVGVQDVAAAGAVLSRVRERGHGERITI